VSISLDESIPLLLEYIPEMRVRMEEDDSIDGEIPHFTFGYGGFASLVTEKLKEEPPDHFLARCFAFVELLCTDGDYETRDLVNSGFLEDLGKPELDEDLQQRARNLMGPLTLAKMREIDAWSE
jgi:hypothetical protein